MLKTITCEVEVRVSTRDSDHCSTTCSFLEWDKYGKPLRCKLFGAGLYTIQDHRVDEVPYPWVTPRCEKCRGNE